LKINGFCVTWVIPKPAPTIVAYLRAGKMLTMRKLIRVGKNVLIKQYFATRINWLKEPDRILFRNKPLKILLLFSHMRSGSSLLTHILNSNPEIIGYGETHLEYSSELDLKKLMLKVYFQGQEFTTIKDVEKLKMSEKYVLDKVLHNNKFLTADFLASDKIVTIFLIREPKRSLKSILELKPKWNESQVLNYYVERLEMLAKYARIINSKERSFFLSHEQLLTQTDLVFGSLQNFLGTKEGFAEEYAILKTTGKEGIGDRLGNIQVGRIIRTPRKLTIKIAPELLEKGEQAFNKCVAILAATCTKI